MVQKYYDDSKDPQVGCVYRTRGRGAEFAIATIVIWQRVEILFTVAGGGLESKVYGWADFKEKWEPAPFDFQKCWDQLNNRFKRRGGTERAEYLLAHFDPAREQPVGEPSMATAKKTTPKAAPAKKPSAKPVEATTKKTAAKPEGKTAPKKAETPKKAATPEKKAGAGRKRGWELANHVVADMTQAKRGAIKGFIEQANSLNRFTLEDMKKEYAKVEGFDEERVVRYFAWCRSKGIFAVEV